MRAFFDSNVIVYAFSDDRRAARALQMLTEGGYISIQSLNEFTNVARRKLNMNWEEIALAVWKILALCEKPVTLDLELHQIGRRVAEFNQLSVYDGMIVAAALIAGCDTLYSEDMHDGLVIDGRLRIVNPFAPDAVTS